MINLKQIRDSYSILRDGDIVIKQNIIINEMADWIESAKDVLGRLRAVVMIVNYEQADSLIQLCTEAEELINEVRK